MPRRRELRKMMKKSRPRKFRNYTFKYESPLFGWLRATWRLIRYQGSLKREFLHKMRRSYRKMIFKPPLTPDQIELYRQAYLHGDNHAPKTRDKSRTNQAEKD